jgi:hypothetical protein
MICSGVCLCLFTCFGPPLPIVAGGKDSQTGRTDFRGSGPYDELENWEPEVLFCPICTDMDSDRAPGPLYLDPVTDDVIGGGLVLGLGRCWTCNTISMRCACGALNTLLEAEEGEWQECAGGCGVEWNAQEEIDRKGVPEGDHLEFRKAGAT